MLIIYFLLYVFIATLTYRLALKFNAMSIIDKYTDTDDSSAVLKALCSGWPISVPIVVTVTATVYLVKYYNKFLDKFIK